MSLGTVVATFRYRHEAETAAGFLRHSRIPAAILADDGGGTYPVLGSGVRLVVPEEDAGRANEILVDAGVLGD